MIRNAVFFGILGAVLLPDAGIAQANPPLTVTGNLQADFNAASDAVAAGHCAQAEPVLAALMADHRVHPGSLPAAMIALRRGICHTEMGDDDQGETWVRQGLPVIEAGGPDLAVDAAYGWRALGRVAMRRLDHDGAVAAFTRMTRSKDASLQIEGWQSLAMVTAFDGDGVALAAVDKAIAVAADNSAGWPAAQRNRVEARLHTVRGRVLMNMGRYAEAVPETERAVKLAGGLTLKVSLDDVSMRGDAAQAQSLAGHRDRARELLAYTGAGRIAQSPFTSATAMAEPDCTGAIGLRPEDSAVVEFSVGDDGFVTSAQTIYSRGSYDVARAFADAVMGWTWDPASVAKMPPFFRVLVRAEIRCSLQNGGLPDLLSPLESRLSDWAQAHGATAAGRSDDNGGAMAVHRGQAIAMLRKTASEREAAGDRTTAAASLLQALLLEKRDLPGLVTDYDHVLALAPDMPAPIRAGVFAARGLCDITHRLGRRPTATMRAGLDALARAPAVAADPLARDTILMRWVQTRPEGGYDGNDRAIFEKVANDEALGTNFPLRQIALLRLSALAARAGDRDGAQALFARTGLSEQQCATIGDLPRLASTGNLDTAFPAEAQAFGFEGWTRVEYNIAANGTVAEPRPVIAYPPLVFVDAATRVVSQLRYAPSFRPHGALACSAKADTINFYLPHLH